MRSTGGHVASWRVCVLAALAGVVGSACAWGPKTRPVHDGETLVLQSLMFRAPASAGWKVEREFEASGRRFVLTSA